MLQYEIKYSTHGIKQDGFTTGFIALTPAEAAFLSRIFNCEYWEARKEEPFSGAYIIDKFCYLPFSDEKLLYYIGASTHGAKGKNREGTTTGVINITPKQANLIAYALDFSNWQELDNPLGDTRICTIRAI